MTFVWPVKMTTEDYEPHLFKKAFEGPAKKRRKLSKAWQKKKRKNEINKKNAIIWKECNNRVFNQQQRAWIDIARGMVEEAALWRQTNPVSLALLFRRMLGRENLV